MLPAGISPNCIRCCRVRTFHTSPQFCKILNYLTLPPCLRKPTFRSLCRCALRVGPETRSWQVGKTLVFCDATEHEAWNRGHQQRVVLLLDFRNPKFHWRLLNPILTPELNSFIKQTWKELCWREKIGYYAWRVINFWR